ncbi:hypothetical protein RvY_18610, partial [Ramazzottius varieornatus]
MVTSCVRQFAHIAFLIMHENITLKQMIAALVFRAILVASRDFFSAHRALCTALLHPR